MNKDVLFAIRKAIVYSTAVNGSIYLAKQLAADFGIVPGVIFFIIGIIAIMCDYINM